jgi:type IV pilus assembly protein PilB
MATVISPHATANAARLGDIVIAHGLATPEVVETAALAARERHEPIGHVLVDMGAITEDQLAEAVAARCGVPFIDVSAIDIDLATATLISPEAALRFRALPIGREGDRLRVAMANPSDVMALDDLTMLTGCEIDRVGAAPDALEARILAIQRASYALDGSDTEPTGLAEEHVLRESADQAPVINLLNSLITSAVEQRASDIHFDWDADVMRVRYRIDGITQDVAQISPQVAPGVISRIKIMSQLDIGEHRIPQDGRMSLVIDGNDVDVRVVTLPVIHGESAVLRILNSSGRTPDLDELGMSPRERERFDAAIRLPYGGILVTGPTGSGKTTTLYGALGILNERVKTIVTIEDPVEYRLDGVKQMQVAPQRGMTFARGLRSILRADPDIVLVGEIRDGETAQIAIEAALTGHLVLSTLHTNDASTAVTRLLEMEIEPFLVASSIVCVVAQRLARVLCTHCRRPATDGRGFEAVGCSHCHGTGYSGRIGLYEVMPVTPEIARLVLERRSAEEIAEKAIEQGMRRMLDDGLEKVDAGVTSLTEVMRVVASAQAAA